MIHTMRSAHSPSEIEQRLRDAAARHKFGVLHVHDLKQTLHSKGIEIEPECLVFDVCNPQAASMALRHDMSVSTVLPCRISVYGNATGSTIATVMPTDLLGATGLDGVDELAGEVQREILAIIGETA